MPAASARARTSSIRNRRLLIGVLVVLAASPTTALMLKVRAATTSDPPQNRSANWQISTPALAIEYRTKRDDTTGVSMLKDGAPAKANPKLSIAWQAASPRPEGILISLEFTYQKVPYKYTTRNAIKPDANDLYSIDLVPLAKKLIDDLNSRLPKDFNPNTTIALDGDVVVNVILIKDRPVPDQPPLNGDYQTSAPVLTSNDLRITFQPTGGGPF